MDERERTLEIASQAIANTEFKIVDVEVKPFESRKQVRVFLDSEKGIVVEDCRKFSRQIEAVLDAEGFLGENYLLEVSSPGADRPITEVWQFRKNIGRPVRVVYHNEAGEEKEFSGTIISVEDQLLLRHTGKKKNDQAEMMIPLSAVVRAQIILPW